LLGLSVGRGDQECGEFGSETTPEGARQAGSGRWEEQQECRGSVIVFAVDAAVDVDVVNVNKNEGGSDGGCAISQRAK